MKIGEAMYKAQQAAGEAGGDAAAGQHAGEKVVDAEFEDVDDKSKKNH